MAFNQTPTTGTLVWAKVEPYPWWPGRVIPISFRSLNPSTNNDSRSSR